MKTFINRERKKAGYTISHMATKMNMSINGYNDLEYGRNKLTLARFIQICNIFNLDPTTIIREEFTDDKNN